MPNGTPDSGAASLVMTCPACATRCRVRKDAPRGSARCPQCGAALDPVRKRPEPARAVKKSLQDPEESEGRAPGADAPGSPARATASKRPRDPEDEDGQVPYGVSAKDEPARRPVPIVEEHEIEEEPEEPEPPSHPLLQGVYGFPWHAKQLRPWFLFGLGFTIIAMLGAYTWYAILIHMTTGQTIFIRSIILILKAFLAAVLWTGVWAAPYFLAVIQETAAGNDVVEGPDTSLGEKLFTFFYVCWVSFCTLAPFGLLGYWLERWTEVPYLRYDVLLFSVLLYPHLLLGSMANDSAIMLLSGKVSLGLLQRPATIIPLYVVSALLAVPCLLLGLLTVLGLQYWLAPVTGFVWSTALLIYGRLLGRVGLIITQEDDEPKRPRRKRKKKRTDDDEE